MAKELKKNKAQMVMPERFKKILSANENHRTTFGCAVIAYRLACSVFQQQCFQIRNRICQIDRWI